MSMRAMHRFVIAAIFGACGVPSPGAAADAYPAKPIRLVVAGPAGGGADVIARPVAQRLSESMKQQVVTDNRPGAATIVAGQVTMAAPPDGYTILLATSSTMCISPQLSSRAPYDASRDFTPITQLATAGLLVSVYPGLPARTAKDLVELAKSQPSKLLYASNGSGSLSHLTTVLFMRGTGIIMTHVPYKGGAPAAIDTIGGHAQVLITAIPTLIAHTRSGRLRAVAVTSPRRNAALPDVPTLSETVLAGFDARQWYSVFGPRGLPSGLVRRLHAEIVKAADNPALREPLAIEGADLEASGPESLARLLAADVARWRKAIRDANVVPD